MARFLLLKLLPFINILWWYPGWTLATSSVGDSFIPASSAESVSSTRLPKEGTELESSPSSFSISSETSTGPSSDTEKEEKCIFKEFSTHYPNVDGKLIYAPNLYRYCIKHYSAQSYTDVKSCFERVNDMRPANPVALRIQTLYHVFQLSCSRPPVTSSFPHPEVLLPIVDYLLGESEEKKVDELKFGPYQAQAILYLAALRAPSDIFASVWQHFCNQFDGRSFPKYSIRCKYSLLAHSLPITWEPCSKLAKSSTFEATRHQYISLQRSLISDTPMSVENVFDLLQKGGNVHLFNDKMRIELNQEYVADIFVQDLITRYGMDVNFHFQGNSFILRHSILDQSRISWLEQLIMFGFDVNGIMKHEQESFLIIALVNDGGQNQTAQLLLRAGANPNVRLANHATMPRRVPGMTALMMTASKAVVQLLLEKGADVNARDNRNSTPLFYASSVKIAEMLIEHGADMSHITADGLNPLMACVWNQMLVKFYIEKGVFEMNAQDLEGRTALHHAFGIKNPDVSSIRRLLNAGSNINTQDKNLITPLMTPQNDIDIHYKIILAAEADINLLDKKGLSALHYAVGGGKIMFVRSLLKAGADANLMTSFGFTPLMIAVSKKQVEIISLLLKYGANPELENARAIGPMSVAEVLQPCAEKPKIIAILKAAISANHPSDKVFDGSLSKKIRISSKTVFLKQFAAENPNLDQSRWTSHAFYRFCLRNPAASSIYFRSVERCCDAADLAFTDLDVPNTRLQALYFLLSGSPTRYPVLPVIQYLLDKTTNWPEHYMTGLLYFAAMKMTYFKYIWSFFCGVYEESSFAPSSHSCQQSVFLLPPDSPELTPFKNLVKSSPWKQAKRTFVKLNSLFTSCGTTPMDELLSVLSRGANIHGFLDCTQFLILEPSSIEQLYTRLFEFGMDVNFYLGHNSLLGSIYNGPSSLKVLELLLKAGMEPDLSFSPTEFPVIAAYSLDSKPLAELLFAYGANPHARVRSAPAAGNDLLSLSNSVEMLQLALSKGVDINAPDHEGTIPIFHAKTVPIAKAMIKDGANLTWLSQFHQTAIMFQTTRIAVLKYLLSLNVFDVNAADKQDCTTLFYAAYYNRTDAFFLLLKSGANVNHATTEEKRTALMELRADLTLDVKALADAKADVNLKDSRGETALMSAAKLGSLNVARTLIQLGSDVNAQDMYGFTALMKAVANHHENMVGYLLKFGGARADTVNELGFAALDIAKGLGPKGTPLGQAIVRLIEAALKKQKELLTLPRPVSSAPTRKKGNRRN